MKLSLINPAGISPRIAPDLLGMNGAQIAENCDLSDGQIRPWYNYSLEQALNKRGIVKTIYLYESLYWFEWEADVDIVLAPVSGDTTSKFYFTGDGIPKESNLTEATSGSAPYPANAYPLAVPTPLAVPSPTATPPPAGSGDPRYIAYIWTVVTSGGKEGYPSGVSTAVLAANGEEVTITGMSLIWTAGTAVEENTIVFPTADEGGDYMYICVQGGTTGSGEPTWNETVDGNTIDNTVIWRCYKNNISSKRIYRQATGDTYSVFNYVDAIDVTETEYVDTKEDTELAGACPSLNIDDGGSSDADWDPPPQDLQGLTYMGNGIVLGFKGKDLYACVPYKPWAWPISYSQALSDEIVAISSSGAGNSAVVTTTGRPALVTGSHSSSLSLTRLTEEKPNLSKRGTVAWGTSSVYPASDGLRSISSDGENTLLTQGVHDHKTWQDYHPATIHAELYDNKYFGFYQTADEEGGFVFDLLTSKFTTLDFYSFAVYTDELTGKLYFLRSTAMSGYNEYIPNPDARSTSGKATQYDLTGGAGVMTGIVQPDFARNLVVTLTDGDTSITALSITIEGTLSTGEAGTETVTFSDLVVGSNDLNEAWAEVDSITIDSVTGAGAGDTIDIGWGKKLGLSNSIDATTDVYKVNINDTDETVDDQTISTTYDTIEFETDPDGSNDYQVWYNA